MRALAVHQHGTSWKAALLSCRRKHIHIESLNTFSTKESLLDYIQKASTKTQLHIVTALPVEHMIVRTFSLDLSHKKQIAKAIPYQVEDLLPFPKEDTVLTFFCKKAPPNAHLVYITATKERFLLEHQEAFTGIDASIITSEAHSLKRFIHFILKDPHSFAFLYPGATRMLAALVEEGALTYVKTCGMHEDKEKLRVQEFLASKKNGEKPIDWIDWSVFQQDLLDYALPIGMGIDALMNDEQSIDLRRALKKSSSSSALLKKGYLAASFLLIFSLCFFSFGETFLSYFEKALEERGNTALKKLDYERKKNALVSLEAAYNTFTKEKQFGSYVPSLTLALSHIYKQFEGMPSEEIPRVEKLTYSITPSNHISLEILWKSPSPQALQTHKMALKNITRPRLTSCREHGSNLFTSFTIE